jgi:hypothetical protein
VEISKIHSQTRLTSSPRTARTAQPHVKKLRRIVGVRCALTSARLTLFLGLKVPAVFLPAKYRPDRICLERVRRYCPHGFVACVMRAGFNPGYYQLRSAHDSRLWRVRAAGPSAMGLRDNHAPRSAARDRDEPGARWDHRLSSGMRLRIGRRRAPRTRDLRTCQSRPRMRRPNPIGAAISLTKRALHPVHAVFLERKDAIERRRLQLRADLAPEHGKRTLKNVPRPPRSISECPRKLSVATSEPFRYCHSDESRPPRGTNSRARPVTERRHRRRDDRDAPTPAGHAHSSVHGAG